MEDDRVPRARTRSVTRKRRRSALYAGDYRKWRQAHDLFVEILLLLVVTVCFLKLFLVQRRDLQARLGHNSPIVVALYDKIVKIRRFSIWLCALLLVVFHVAQNIGMMSAEEATPHTGLKLPS
jgi:hypothetical protein